MEYLFSVLFLALHLVNYEIGLNRILFFGAGLVLFVALFYACYKKSENFLCTCLMLFCHTWQASWINIFGVWGSPLQITWFYLIGVLVLGYCIVNIKKAMDVPLPPVALALFAGLFMFLPFPLIISPSVSEGLKEILIIAFFFIMAFAAFVFKDTVPYEKRTYIVNSFVFTMLVSCGLLIVQYLLYKTAGITVFRYSVGTYYGGLLASSKLLMEDTSCSTIMIAGASFYLLEKLNKKNVLGILAAAAVLMAGIGVTTRRTSIVSIGIVLVLYVFLHYKGAVKKMTMGLIVFGMLSVMLIYLYYTRSINTVGMLTDDNGRIKGYLSALALLFENPFGVGYDNTYLAPLVGGIVPHNSMLRWMDMGGFALGILIGALLIYFLVYAYRKKNRTEFWFVFYCVFASNLIPDILNGRLFILPVMMAFLIADKEETNEESIAL